MVIKYNNIFHSKALRILPKFENKPSGNPASNSTRDKQRIAGRVEKKTRLKFFTYVQIVRKKWKFRKKFILRVPVYTSQAIQKMNVCILAPTFVSFFTFCPILSHNDIFQSLLSPFHLSSLSVFASLPIVPVFLLRESV
jgi:hypothetical protein